MAKENPNGVFICERSGFKYLRKYAVKEPGTGYWVHKDESDGEYNIVDHPQNFVTTKAEDQALPWTSSEESLVIPGGVSVDSWLSRSTILT